MLSRFILLIVVLVGIGCDLPQDPGPMPTIIIDWEFEPGHNVLGVLRNESQPGTSFLRIERAWETEETSAELDVVIRDAEVTVFTDSSEWDFIFVNDSINTDIYLNPEFLPRPDREYYLIVKSPGLPTLTGSVIVPAPPALDSVNIIIEPGQISFDLGANSTIRMYDIYVFSEFDVINQRLISDGNGVSVYCSLSELTGKPALLVVYGYEANLAAYQTSPNTIKPQTYHETIITVEGGYGCFGAVSVASTALD